MDIKDTWGSDSSPGTAQDRTHKCGNLFATMGAVGAATLPAYTDDIGDRATVTPGTIPVLSTGGSTKSPTTGLWTPSPGALSRAAQMGLNTLGTTYFNGYSIMHGLAEKATASGSVSISFWISPDGPAQGCILGSPFQTYHAAVNNNSNPGSQDFSVYLNFNPVCGGGLAEAFHPDTATAVKYAIMGHVPSTGAITLSLARQAEIDYSLGVGSGVAATISDPSYSAGTVGNYYHVMIAIHTVSGRVKATIYVNDTAICTDLAISPDYSSFLTGEPALIPFGTVSGAATYPALRDGATQAVQPIVHDPNVWHIGGRLIDFINEWDFAAPDELSVLPDGDGLYGAVTEVWIAEGQYIDFSVQANRNKFHTQMSPGGLLDPYVPVNLGAHGQTPTGTKPTMYFTGTPSKFVINRVNGAKATVAGADLTFDGRFPGN